MYKIFKNPLIVVAIILLTATTTNAALLDRGNGMIFDDVLNITWLQDANFAMSSGYDADGRMSWNNANIWAQQLEFGGYNDWRLASVNPQLTSGYNYTYLLDGTSDWGFNNSSPQSELGYMFYNNLGGQAQYSVDGVPNAQLGLGNTDMFLNVFEENYWSGTFYEPAGRIDSAFLLRFATGEQHVHGINDQFYAWAVRDGDVSPSVIPVPAAVWLFCSGLLVLSGLVRSKK